MGIGAMEPLIPNHPDLLHEAGRIVAAAERLGGHLHPVTLAAVADLLRTVNCYYSNLIEGHDTHPVDIERAMKEEYAPDSVSRNLQLEAAAHIEVQLLIEQKLSGSSDFQVTAPEFLAWIHREFYQRLPDALRLVQNAAGTKTRQIEPGVFRSYDVQVGAHIAPPHAEVPGLLERFAAAYDPAHRPPAEALILLGAAHHRLLWIHPFGDGNGRVARLMTDAWLRRIGVGAHGLWTASRGLARRSDDYRNALAAADAPRWNDYDGRGALSHQALVDFVRFFLEVCRDQVDYMGGLLKIDELADRTESYGKARELGVIPRPDGAPAFRPEATRLLKHLVYRGFISRAEARDIVNLEERTARRVVSVLVDNGFVTSASSRAPLELRIPAHAGPYLLPGIYGADR